MKMTGFHVNSLLIDRIEKRWVTRGLFVFAFAISVAYSLLPIGDSDFSKFNVWYDKLSSSDFSSASTQIEFPVITMGNVLFLLFTLLAICIFVLVSIIYARIYIGEMIVSKTDQSKESSFVSLPMFIAFFILIIIPLIIMFLFFWFAYIIIVPAMLLSPILILVEKKNIYDSIAYSFKYTNGYKLSIFWNLLTLYCLFWFIESISSFFLPSGNNAGVFLDGFFTAFAALAVGRTIGIFYEMIQLKKDTSHSEQEK